MRPLVYHTAGLGRKYERRERPQMATVEKRGKGYRITVAAGIDLNGKQIRHRMVWTPDEKLTARQIEKELNRQVVKFEEQVKAGTGAVDGNIRFVDFANRYLAEYGRLNLKPTTLSNYERNLKRINLAIGHLRLKDITPLHIQAFYRNLQEDGIRQRVTTKAKPELAAFLKKAEISQSALASKAGITHQTISRMLKGESVNLASAEKIAAATDQKLDVLFNVIKDTTPLAPATIHSYHRTLSSIFERAVKWRCISSNPAERAELPSLAGHKARYLDEPDAKRMLQLLQDEPIKWRAPIVFDLLSGLRRAELLGLRWQDIDLDTGVLHIVQTSNYVSGTGVYVSTPKTEDSTRFLRVSRTAILMLLEYKAWQDDMKAKVGDAWEGTDDRVFTNEVGRPIFPTSLTQWMGKFIKRTGLPSSSVQSLRHTYASLLIADGTPVVVVSNNLGHAQVSTTSDIYSHIISSAEAKAVEVMDRFSEDIHPKFTPKLKKAGVS